LNDKIYSENFALDLGPYGCRQYSVEKRNVKEMWLAVKLSSRKRYEKKSNEKNRKFGNPSSLQSRLWFTQLEAEPSNQPTASQPHAAENRRMGLLEARGREALIL
jgi:hypothetical protein